MNNFLASKQMIEALRQKGVRLGYARQNENRPTEMPHLHWMLLQLQEGKMSSGKAGRWLGWVQACFTMIGLFSLKEMKELNSRCSCDYENCPKKNEPHSHNNWEVVHLYTSLEGKRYSVLRPDGEWWEVYAISEEDARGDAEVNYES